MHLKFKCQLLRCTLNMKRVQDLPDNYINTTFTLFQLYPIIPKQLPADSTQPEPEDGSERSHSHCLKGDLISVQTCVILSPVDPSLFHFQDYQAASVNLSPQVCIDIYDKQCKESLVNFRNLTSPSTSAKTILASAMLG